VPANDGRILPYADEYQDVTHVLVSHCGFVVANTARCSFADRVNDCVENGRKKGSPRSQEAVAFFHRAAPAGYAPRRSSGPAAAEFQRQRR